ncbi:MAG: hypothetical protein ACLGHY_13625, partial [Gammaproteobacteria bacterium]
MTETQFDLRRFLSQLPNRPGVYRMIAAGEVLLYVGKAGDLKKRVSSYFNRGEQSPRIAHMIQRIERIEIKPYALALAIRGVSIGEQADGGAGEGSSGSNGNNASTGGAP